MKLYAWVACADEMRQDAVKNCYLIAWIGYFL